MKEEEEQEQEEQEEQENEEAQEKEEAELGRWQQHHQLKGEEAVMNKLEDNVAQGMLLNSGFMLIQKVVGTWHWSPFFSTTPRGTSTSQTLPFVGSA